MFNFGKKSISLNEIATLLADLALAPLVKPSGQDIMFAEAATQLGMSGARFSVESAALVSFTVFAAIKTWSMRHKARQISKIELADTYSLLLREKFVDELPLRVRLEFMKLTGMNIEEVYELFSSRLDEYSLPEYAVEPNKRIPYLFASLCDVPDPDEKLMRIGWSLFMMRGQFIVDLLKKFKGFA